MKTRLVVCMIFLTCGCSSDQAVGVDPPIEPEQRGGDFYPAWSPDGNTIAFVREDFDSSSRTYSSLLNTIDVATAIVETVTSVQGSGINSLSWSPDGRWLLLSAGPGIFKILSTGDSLTQLTQGQFHISPSWSRSSNRIFYAANAGDEMGIYSMNPDSSNRVRWTDRESQIQFTDPNCFPNSDTLTGIAYRNDSICIAVYYPGDQEFVSLPMCGFLWVGNLAMSPRKRYIAFNANLAQADEIHLYLIDRSGGSLREVVASLTSEFDFSPDGQRIVYPDIGRTRGLQIIDLETNEVIQLTPGH